MQLHSAALIGIFVTSYLLPGLGGNASIAFADPTAPKALPAEYRILAGILARPMDVASATTKPSPNLTEAIADAQACVMDLRKIHSTDDEINQLASIGIDATEDLTKRIEDLDVSLMSKPPRESTSTGAILPVVEAIVTHHPVVWLLHAFAQKANAQQNDQKKSWKDGVEAELAHIIDDSHQLEAAAMLLPKVATNYSAPESPNVGTITMRFVEAWGPLPVDVLELVNTGHRGTESKQFTYPFKAWKKGEAKTFPRLPFNPDSTDVVVSFPDTGYRYESKIGD